LRDLIHERIGTFYQNNKRDLLEDKLASLVMARGFDSFLDYYYLLKYDTQEAETEWKKVTEAIRVPETFFWREMDQIQILSNILLPQYFAKNPNKSLRIWSAACSSGEEPLSIAMVLNEAGWFDRANIEIVANDISAKAIEKAQEGIYRSYSLRNLPEKIREKYFQREAAEIWRVTPKTLALIKWSTANIIVPTEVAALATASIIFCRNVFIYFSEDKIRQTVRTFFELMPNNSYLFVGISESLLKVTTDFKLQEIGGTFVYFKP
jgi:chemotaxis protein methyltransferase CheR